MALDAGMISALTKELQDKLTGSKLEKIHQPERDEIDFYLRASGRVERLVLSAAPGNPKMNLSSAERENPAVPPMFCTLLRKHLAGGILQSVHQLGFERAVCFTFSARDDMGFDTKRKIIIEMMGKYCNLLLLGDNDRILGVLRPVDFTSSDRRQLLCGMIYELPPLQEGKEDPLSENEENFMRRLDQCEDRPADKFILTSYRGISPLVAREISFCASGSTDTPVSLCAKSLFHAFRSVVDRISSGNFAPCILKTDGAPFEYSFLPITQYGSSAEILPFDSPSALIEAFYGERDRNERVHRRAQNLYKTLNNTESRLLRKSEIQKKELDDCAEKERYRQWGDLITANLYALTKGQEEVRLINYYSPEMEEVTLKLDKRLSPAANAQKYYKKYNKAKNAEVELTLQLEKSRKELAYIRSVLDALDRASLPADIEEIRTELVRTGYASALKIPLPKKALPMRCTEYRTTNGFRLLCGRNNLQNDRLTFEQAGKNDWWFHVHGAPGSHVVLFCNGVDDPPAEDFTDAATVAATNSKLADGKSVTVDYTKVRNVKKPPASRPGFVIYHTNYSTVVNPDKERCEKLKV